MKSARDIVRGQDIVTVDPTMSAREAASIMADRQIGAVPVTDGDRIVGIFTERDALTRIVAAVNSFGGVFILDDKVRIVTNAQIRELWPPWAAMHWAIYSSATHAGTPSWPSRKADALEISTAQVVRFSA